jgi:polyphosphate glucokinase
MARKRDDHAPRKGRGKRTLAVDIGGSKIKATVLDSAGEPVADPVRTRTPRRLGPAALLDLVAELAEELPAYDRVSVGFPGIVVDGVVYTAPNLGTRRFRGARLAAETRRRLGRPTRVVNDAEMHAYGVISEAGVEVVLTLGTGVGVAVFCDGRPGPQFALTTLPPPTPGALGRARASADIGNAARKRLGDRVWSDQVRRVIDHLRTLTDFDRLFLGGGNGRRVRGDLPDDVIVVDNAAAFGGGARLWRRRRARRRATARRARDGA